MLSWRISRLGFVTPIVGEVSLGPLVVMASIIVWPNTGDYVMGMSKQVSEKEEQNR